MKITLIIFLAGLSLSAGFGDFLYEMERDARGAFTFIVGGIKKAINEAESFLKEALFETRLLAEEFEDYVDEFYRGPVKAIAETVGKIRSYMYIIHKGKIPGIVFAFVESAVNDTEDAIRDFLRNCRDNLKDATKTTVESLMNETSSLQPWGKNLVKNSKKPEEAKKEVQKFITDETKKIKKCAKTASKPINEVYRYANTVLKTVGDLFRDLLGDMEGCKNRGTMKQCLEVIPKVFKTEISKAKEDLAKLNTQKEAKKIAVKVVKDLACIPKIKLEVELRKLAIETKVKNM